MGRFPCIDLGSRRSQCAHRLCDLRCPGVVVAWVLEDDNDPMRHLIYGVLSRVLEVLIIMAQMQHCRHFLVPGSLFKDRAALGYLFRLAAGAGSQRNV
jgi:hypothetical protein